MKKILLFALLLLVTFGSSIVTHTYNVLPNAIESVQTNPVVQHVYLKNTSGDIIKYPKIGSTYKCWADVLPPYNDSVLSAKWDYDGPGISTQSGVDAVEGTDGVSWYTSGNLSPNAEGNIECDFTLIDSNLAERTFNQIFVVTTPIPGCTHDDYCTVTSNQQYSASTTTVTSRYENITINSGVTLTTPLVSGASAPISGQTLYLYADDTLDIQGTLYSSGNNAGTSGSCRGASGSQVNIYSKNFKLSGAITLKGGNGGTVGSGCSGTDASGGSSGRLSIVTIDGVQTGDIRIYAGNPGSYPTSQTFFEADARPARRIDIGAYEQYNFSGTIFQWGGNATATSSSPTTCSNVKSRGDTGGEADSFYFYGGIFNFSSGTITIRGGNGGAGPTNTYCRSTDTTCGGKGGDVYGESINVDKFINGATWTVQGGTGGAKGGRACDSCAYVITAGTGGRSRGSIWTMYNESKFSAAITLVGGSAGTGGTSPYCTIGGSVSGDGVDGTISTNHTVTYVDDTGSSTLDNYFLPASHATITQDTSIAHSGPSVDLNFTNPLADASVSPVPNVTLNWTGSNDSYAAVIEVSTNNASWYPLLGTVANPPSSYTGTTNWTWANVSINRETSWIYFRGRLRDHNLYSSWDYTRVNATPVATNISGVRIPSADPVTQSYIDFYCNYSRADDNQSVQSAGVYVNIDGVNYSADFVVADQTYYYRKVNATNAGTNNWTCVAERPNFNQSTSQNYTYEYGNYIVELPSGHDEILLTCPFPTIYSMTPAGQKAGVGILRISNNVGGSLSNYSIMLNQSPPSGMSIYGRCDKMVSGTSLTGWSSINSSSPFTCWQNVNSTNSSAYLWMKADCAGAAVGITDPFNYIVYEEN